MRHGDIYLVDGTNIWTTMAQHATHAFCLARTGQSRARGIIFLLIELDQPGVSIRPILSASGDHEVNEVFLTGVRAPVDDRVGEEGEGWAIARFLLARELKLAQAPGRGAFRGTFPFRWAGRCSRRHRVFGISCLRPAAGFRLAFVAADRL